MVKVYTTKTCSYCAMVKKFLQLKEVEYEEIDVTDNPEKRQELFQATNMTTVPVVENNGKFAVGFQPAKLAEVLK